ALIRRARAPRWAPLICGDLELLDNPRQVRVGERVVQLSPRERSLLEVLVRRQEEVVSRAEIFKLVFGYEFDPGTNVIDVHVAHLRKKLAGGGPQLRTVRGAGFMLTRKADES
ncbi:MAG: winged helix-turn-helix transcriptional regulator, partial [Myxococcales bacterium]|nr:winged helix-turn-helix transcriptional regulator [Myxococcales bacterium]